LARLNKDLAAHSITPRANAKNTANQNLASLIQITAASIAAFSDWSNVA
jgi:hypothetical protein